MKSSILTLHYEPYNSGWKGCGLIDRAVYLLKLGSCANVNVLG